MRQKEEVVEEPIQETGSGDSGVSVKGRSPQAKSHFRADFAPSGRVRALM
jgi:hypothetical protein